MTDDEYIKKLTTKVMLRMIEMQRGKGHQC